MGKLRIQFINANAVPTAPLQIDKEKREILDRIRLQALVFDAPAARFSDVARVLRDNLPDVVHFSAHGSPAREIMLLGEGDRVAGIDRAALAKLFALRKGGVRLVLLNACFSEKQAAAIAEHVETVIAVRETIGDDVALLFSKQFYEALSTGATISQAYEEACAVLRNSRVPKAHWPLLISRNQGGTALRYTESELNSFREDRRLRHSQDRKRYGVFVESFTLTKTCSADGYSELTYEVEGLTAEDDTVIDSLYFSVESIAGIVCDPVPDARADGLAVYWDPAPVSSPVTFGDVVDSVRCTKGAFRFGQKLTRKTKPYTFGWTVRAHNMDAVTTWEFNHLYPTKKDRVHVDGRPLNPPSEYMARLVWVPMAKLTIRVQLPEGMPGPPRLRYFELVKDPPIPREEIVSGSTLVCYPRSDSPWWKENGRWETQLESQDKESSGLDIEGVNADLVVPYPALGSWYSLDWKLRDPKLYGRPFRFKSEAEEIRKRLLEHRGRRIAGGSNPVSDQIGVLYRELHKRLADRFWSGGPDDRLETALMTYDADTSRLVVAEGLVNDCQPPNDSAWIFALPFGMGLSGRCFRSGVGAVTYARAMDKLDERAPDNYLLVPGSVPHEYLLSLPIDHPHLTEEMTTGGDVQRCRQLIGVLTIGSTYAPSQLQDFCVDPPEEEYDAWRTKLQALRNDCQRECDKLSLFLLNPNGGKIRV